MDLTPLRLAAPDLAADTIVLAAPEDRHGAVTALQVLLELLPERALPVPLDPPQLARALPTMRARNARGNDLFDEVPAVLASSVLPEPTVDAIPDVLGEHGGPWGLIVQTDGRFRTHVPTGLDGRAALTCRLDRDDRGRFTLTVLATARHGLAGATVPLHTAHSR